MRTHPDIGLMTARQQTYSRLAATIDNPEDNFMSSGLSMLQLACFWLRKIFECT